MAQIKLNLGCGTAIIPGYINVDNYKFPDKKVKNFVKADIRRLPFKDDYADYILMDQVLEHIPMADIPKVLHEVRRVLKPGGRAVIMVPDFRSAAQQWLSLDHDGGFNPFVYQYLSEVLYGNQKHEGEFHKAPMCAGFLNYCLNMVGLTKVKFIIHPEGGKLPNYPGMNSPDNQLLRNAQLVADITK